MDRNSVFTTLPPNYTAPKDRELLTVDQLSAVISTWYDFVREGEERLSPHQLLALMEQLDFFLNDQLKINPSSELYEGGTKTP